MFHISELEIVSTQLENWELFYYLTSKNSNLTVLHMRLRMLVQTKMLIS